MKVDGSGRRYVYQALDELDKNHRENDDPSDSTGDGRMYERAGSPFCPVSAYELYLSKLNPDISWLWQRPKDTVDEDESIWYCKSPLGKNTLGSLMNIISERAGLSKPYTNHCIRATAVTVLDEVFEARHIMRVSGHKSETSIRAYSRRLSEPKQREMSATLRDFCSTAVSSEVAETRNAC